MEVNSPLSDSANTEIKGLSFCDVGIIRSGRVSADCGVRIVIEHSLRLALWADRALHRQALFHHLRVDLDTVRYAEPTSKSQSGSLQYRSSSLAEGWFPRIGTSLCKR
jgi:hypothetical protein